MYTTASTGRRFESARVHRRVPAWVASMGAALSALMVATAAHAQTIEYTVTEIPPVGGAFFTTVPFGINNSGEVVGWAQASGPEFFLRAWRWSAQEGLILLPPPPGSASDRYGARDISDNGIIVGDEGGGGVPRLGPRMIRMRAPRRNEHGLLTGRAEKSHANGFVLINGLVQSEDQQ